MPLLAAARPEANAGAAHTWRPQHLRASRPRPQRRHAPTRSALFHPPHGLLDAALKVLRAGAGGNPAAPGRLPHARMRQGPLHQRECAGAPPSRPLLESA